MLNLKKVETKFADICTAGLLACMTIPRKNMGDGASLQAIAVKYFDAWTQLKIFCEQMGAELDKDKCENILYVWEAISEFASIEYFEGRLQ